MAADNDILTLAEAKQACGIGTADTDRDDMLASWITAVSTKLDRAVGNVIYGTVVAEPHDGGAGCVFLDCTPVASISQVVEYDGTVAGTLTAQSNSSQTTGQYTFDPVSGRVDRRDSNTAGRFPDGTGNVVVSYVAGRFAAGTITDDRYPAAARLMIENAWRQYAPTIAAIGEFDAPAQAWPRFIVPNAVKELLADEWRQGAGF